MERDDLTQDMEREPSDNILDGFVEEVEAELADLDLEQKEVKLDMGGAEEEKTGYLQMLDTFMDIMHNALKPVTRYVKAIKLGLENRELYEIIWLTAAPLLEKVQQVGLVEPAAKLEDFVDATEKLIHAPERLQSLRVEFFMTFAILQDTFKLDYRGNRLAIQNLLDFYGIVRSDEKLSEEEMRKFFAIGISSLTWVRKTTIAEIQSLSGMQLSAISRMKSIIRHFRREKEYFYAKKRQGRQPTASAEEVVQTAAPAG